MAPMSMRQAIIGPNDGIVYWCIYASLSRYELTYNPCADVIGILEVPILNPLYRILAEIALAKYPRVIPRSNFED